MTTEVYLIIALVIAFGLYMSYLYWVNKPKEIPYISPDLNRTSTITVPAHLKRVTSHPNIVGKYFVCFKDPEPWFGNDPLEADIIPFKGMCFVKWDNGQTCVISHEYLLIFEER